MQDLKICIYIPSNLRVSIRSREDKLKIIEAYLERYYKATWRRPEWNKENIKILLSRHKTQIIDAIKIKKIEELGMANLIEGYPPPLDKRKYNTKNAYK